MLNHIQELNAELCYIVNHRVKSAAGVMVAQDMLYVYRLLDSIGLSVELPMLLEMENKGAVNVANSWSMGRGTHHNVRNHFSRELKDEGLIVVKHVSGDENDADIFTKNTAAPVFNRHIRKFVDIDKYMEKNTPNLELGRVLDCRF